MATPTSYVRSVQWAEGEQAAFSNALYENDFDFYVPPEKFAEYQRRAPSMTEAEWRAVFATSSTEAKVGLALAPKNLVFEYLEGWQKKYPDSYASMKVVLSRFNEEAIVFLLAQLPAHTVRALGDLGPVDAAEVAPFVAAVLTSNEKSKIKSSAQQWLLRHPKAAVSGLAPQLTGDDLGARTAALAALDLIENGPPKVHAPTHLYAGRVAYRAHHVTPLVLGDFEAMKDWRGSPEGVDGPALVSLPKGEVAVAEIDRQAPDVFYKPGVEIVLLAKSGSRGSLRESFVDEELQAMFTAPASKTFWSMPLTISSSALVIAVAFNATVEQGASVDGLDELCYYEGTPRLPKSVPTSVVALGELLIIPLPNGVYAMTDDKVDQFRRCTIRRA